MYALATGQIGLLPVPAHEGVLGRVSTVVRVPILLSEVLPTGTQAT